MSRLLLLLWLLLADTSSWPITSHKLPRTSHKLPITSHKLSAETVDRLKAAGFTNPSPCGAGGFAQVLRASFGNQTVAIKLPLPKTVTVAIKLPLPETVESKLTRPETMESKLPLPETVESKLPLPGPQLEPMSEKNLVHKVMANEARQLQKLRGCDHVMPLYGTIPSLDALILPYAEHGDLFSWIYKHRWQISGGLVPKTVLLHLALHTAIAVKQIHDKGTCHGDIKPENILLTANPYSSPSSPYPPLALADFGLAEDANQTSHRVTGSEAYMSPEKARHFRAKTPFASFDCKSADVWATAVTIRNLFTGSSLPQTHPQDALARIRTARRQRRVGAAFYPEHNPYAMVPWVVRDILDEVEIDIDGLLQRLRGQVEDEAGGGGWCFPFCPS
ncbi:MAG: hypothetical protein SGCHY_004117 [Lobulomycetales sp.]